ncbi:MAG: Mth938-like domain-containing protein [Emcibacter sp.]|nr:Mth938-like domain-containing protein [Emcibacter sp.]
MDFKEVTSQSGTAITSYGDGGFRLGEIRCLGSILITPKGYYPWDVTDVSSITLESLGNITNQAENIDILLVGTGEKMVFLSKELRSALLSAHISVDVMGTGAAARTYNVLLAEGRKVAAAIIAIA